MLNNKSLRSIVMVILIIAAYLLSALFVLFMLLRAPGYDLKSFLAYYVVYVLALTFILLIVAFLFNFKYIKELCGEIGSKYILPILLISLAGIFATAMLAPRIHRIYYDEDIYNHIGQCMALNGKAVLCNEGYYENGELQIVVGEYNKQPSGYPFLTSIVFRIFGVNESFVFIMNNIIFGLTLIVIFFITFLLFHDAFAGILASLCYLFIPINLQWFNTAAVEPSTVFFLCVPVFALLLFLKYKKTINLFFVACSLAFSLYFRMESIFIFLSAGLLLLLKEPRVFLKKPIYICGALLLLLATGFLLHMYAVRGENWGAVAGPKLGFDSFFYNLSTNSIFYFNNKEFPLLFSLFGIVGLIFYKTIGYFKEKLSVCIWFLAFWGLFLFFYAGSYRYGQDVRFSILSYPPLVIFAGLGGSFVCSLFKAKIKYAKLILMLLLVFNFTWFLPFIRAEGEEAWAARRDHKYAEEFAGLMQDNSVIYTHNPNMFLLRGKSAVQTMNALYNQGIVDRHLGQFMGGVYLHFNFWSNVDDPQQRSYTEYIMTNYECLPIKEYYYRNFKYGLYKISGRKQGF